MATKVSGGLHVEITTEITADQTSSTTDDGGIPDYFDVPDYETYQWSSLDSSGNLIPVGDTTNNLTGWLSEIDQGLNNIYGTSDPFGNDPGDTGTGDTGGDYGGGGWGDGDEYGNIRTTIPVSTEELASTATQQSELLANQSLSSLISAMATMKSASEIETVTPRTANAVLPVLASSEL